MSASCEIVVKDHLDADWSGWFEGLTITYNDEGQTILSGPIRDQAALYGILVRMRDLALFLISVKYRVDESRTEKIDSDNPSYLQ